jgi:hypothetical protein
VATSEPVVLHHRQEGGAAVRDEMRPSTSMVCWAAFVNGMRRGALA